MLVLGIFTPRVPSRDIQTCYLEGHPTCQTSDRDSINGEMANRRGGGGAEPAPRSRHEESEGGYEDGSGVGGVSALIKHINTLATATLSPPNLEDPKRRRETKPGACGREEGGASTLTHVPGGNFIARAARTTKFTALKFQCVIMKSGGRLVAIGECEGSLGRGCRRGKQGSSGNVWRAKRGECAAWVGFS